MKRINLVKSNSVEKWEWIVLLIILSFPLLSFFYMDTNSIVRCGIDVTKSIVDGQFLDYFDYTSLSLANQLMVHEPAYDILFYLTVGVWEIPVAIAELVTGKTLEHNFIALGYSKMLLIVFLLLSAWMLRKIALEIGLSEKASAWCSFAFASNGFVFAYLCIAGQYDILGIFFTLTGAYYYLKEDTKKFIIFFAIAVQYKFFPLFVFFPLLLLKEKNLIKIAGQVICVALPMFILGIPFLDDEAVFGKKAAIQADMIDRIFRNRISIFETEVPLSVLMVGAVFVYCYLKEISDSEKKYYAIYIPFLTFAALFLSFPFFPYWIVNMLPWMTLLFFMRKQQSGKRLAIELGMVAAIILAQYSHFYWVFEIGKNTEYMLMDILYPFTSLKNPLTMSNWNSILPISDNESVLYGIYIVLLVTLIYLYYPKADNKYLEESYPYRSMCWLRLIIGGFIGTIPFLLYIGSIVRNFLL